MTEPQETVAIPAWAYCYTGPDYPSRGLAAWALLRHRYGETAAPRRRQSIQYLAAAMGITEYSVRRQLRRGEGIFWRDGRLRSWHELGAAVLDRSSVDVSAMLLVPLAAFVAGLQAQRSWLNQAALTRGNKPCSVGYSCDNLRRKRSAVTGYRRRLKQAGRLLQVEHYQRIVPQGGGNLATQTTFPREKREFAKDGYLWRRLSDVIILLDAAGKPLDLLANTEKAGSRTLHPRVYFYSRPEYEDWVARGLPVAPTATLMNLFQPASSINKRTYIRSISLLNKPRGKGSASNPFTSPSSRSKLGVAKGYTSRPVAELKA